MNDLETASHRPDIEAARVFTRDLGPASILAGALISVHGLILHTMDSPFAQWFVFVYGLVLVLFGAAAFFRTENMSGQLLRWVVVSVFLLGGGLALFQWSRLIWGGPSAMIEGDVTMMGFYLMAGPALLVPAGLAVARPGWVPLIVVPAIVSLAAASVLGHGSLLLMSILETDEGVGSPLPDVMLMVGVVLASTALLFYSGQKGITAARRRGEEKLS